MEILFEDPKWRHWFFFLLSLNHGKSNCQNVKTDWQIERKHFQVSHCYTRKSACCLQLAKIRDNPEYCYKVDKVHPLAQKLQLLQFPIWKKMKQRLEGCLCLVGLHDSLLVSKLTKVQNYVRPNFALCIIIEAACRETRDHFPESATARTSIS